MKQLMHLLFETSGRTGTGIAGLIYFQIQSLGKRPALRDEFMVKYLLKAPDSGGLKVIVIKNNK